MRGLWLLLGLLWLGGDLLAQSPYVALRVTWRRHQGQPYPRHLRLYAQDPADHLFLRNRSDTLATARRWQLYHPEGGTVFFEANGDIRAELGQRRVLAQPRDGGWRLSTPGDTLWLMPLPPPAAGGPPGARLERRLVRPGGTYAVPLLQVQPDGLPALRWTVAETGTLEGTLHLFRILAILITVREQYLR